MRQGGEPTPYHCDFNSLYQCRLLLARTHPSKAACTFFNATLSEQPSLRQHQLYRRKIRTVFRQRAKLCQCRQMRRRAVSLVLGETVLRITLVQCVHFRIPRHFGQHGSRRNGGDFRIALHHAFGRHAQIRRHAVAINPHFCRLLFQALHRAFHRQHGGVQDIQPRNFAHIGTRNAIRRSLRLNLHRQFVALFFAELFGIRQTAQIKIRRQNHRRRKHAAHQTATPRLIHARMARQHRITRIIHDTAHPILPAFPAQREWRAIRPPTRPNPPACTARCKTGGSGFHCTIPPVSGKSDKPPSSS